MDDLIFSNSITTEHNILVPGSLGHIARTRKIDISDYSSLDRFLHYDQVGSVTMKSDGDGEMIIAEKQYQDAFGNRRLSQTSGRWDADASGWSHNTKERDEDIGIVYMYQRWYQPETGTFLSRAPYRPMIEHQYGFANNNPLSYVDPDGRILWIFPPILVGAGVNLGVSAYESTYKTKACESAKENHDYWGNPDSLTAGGNRLGDHPRYASLCQQAREEYLSECFGINGAASQLVDTGIQINDALTDVSRIPKARNAPTRNSPKQENCCGRATNTHRENGDLGHFGSESYTHKELSRRMD